MKRQNQSLKIFNKKHFFKEVGLTLIEVLVAITLLSILMLYIYSIVDESTTTKDRTIAEDRQLLQVETALSRFRLDFSLIYSPLYFSAIKKKGRSDSEENQRLASRFKPSEKYPQITEKGIPVPIFEMPDRQSIVFLTSSNKRKVSDSRQSNYAWLKYTLRSNSIEDQSKKFAPNELIRYYTPHNPYSKEHDWDEVKPQLLLRNVKSLEFLIWDDEKTDFVSKSLELEKGGKAIRGLKLVLVWVDSMENEHTEERIYRPLWPYFDVTLDKDGNTIDGKPQD
ncbi:MAG: prepilin-type N-terminal cleavage/methylation domain-containing protein [Bacteriovoracaceae bacterium]|nr:prepilin-type N-terminal cleavage/methylation domain-containing protein [Bacteriovoracaceae bacterium]